MLWELRHYERICIVTLLCQKVEIIQSTYAILAQDAGDSSSPVVLETNVILNPPTHTCQKVFIFPEMVRFQYMDYSGSGTEAAPSPA